MRIKKIFLTVVIFLGVLIGAGYLLPSDWKVERSTVIQASPQKIYPWISNFKSGWPQWSSFEYKDPQILRSDAVDGVEFELTMTSSGLRVYGEISFQGTDNGTRVIWTGWGNLGLNPFLRLKGLFMNSMMGPAFEKSLQNLKLKAENRKTQNRETATFAAGCFWGVEEFFRKTPGVVETGVGYSGGKTVNPNYAEVSSGATGHAESVEVIFDPTVISYEKLVELFFKMHDPTTLNAQGNDVGTQYRSAIFFHNSKQRQIAEQMKARVEKSGAWKENIVTEISEAGPFYEAEEEHQKYLLRHPNGYDNHYLRNITF